MTRIDFYILPEQTLLARQQFVCRLLQKAVRLGHRCYIHCDNAEQAQALDELLWQFQATSFLPHKQSHTEGSNSSIEIGFNEPPEHHNDVLINLGLNTPAFFSRFARVSEVVTQDDATLHASRNNYRFYQQRNYPLYRHDLRQRG